MRNLTSYIYDGSVLESLNGFVVEYFLPEVEKLNNTLRTGL